LAVSPAIVVFEIPAKASIIAPIEQNFLLLASKRSVFIPVPFFIPAIWLLLQFG
jgi:hypothetical protein